MLAHDGALAGASLLALVPALIGMALGQWVRWRAPGRVPRRLSRPARRALTLAGEFARGHGYQLQSMFAFRALRLTLLL
jgi:hypothetical protein